MKQPLLALVLVSLTLPGCARLGESPLNPKNWFKPGTAAPATLAPKTGYAKIAVDGRQNVDQVTALTAAPAHGGLIVTAIGLPPTQGWWDAELVELDDGKPVDGTLRFAFVVYDPRPGSPAANRSGAPHTREVTAGIFLTAFDLDEVRRITVEGAQGTRSISR